MDASGGMHPALDGVMTFGTMARLALLSALAIGSIVGGCASSEDESDAEDNDSEAAISLPSSKDVPATTKSDYARFGSVTAIRSIDHDTVTLRLYETLGSEGANGNMLWLGVFADQGDGFMFDLGLNVRTVNTATANASEVTITGTKDVTDSNGNSKSGVPFEAHVRFTTKEVDDELTVKPEIEVVYEGKTSPVQAATDPADAFIGDLYDMESDTSEAQIARVYTRSMGDSVSNGANVFVSISNEGNDVTFDLGLNVAAITSLKFAGKNALRLEGLQDVTDSKGKIVQTEFAYTLNFTIDDDGTPGNTIKLTLSR